MLALPLYVALTTVVPAGIDPVLTLAVPAARPTVPRVVVPATKVTVPVGTSPEEEAIVAVNLTLRPAVEGFADDTSVVLVVARFTCCKSADDALTAFAESPR